VGEKAKDEDIIPDGKNYSGVSQLSLKKLSSIQSGRIKMQK
jgi:hypothetical protein